MDKKKIFWRAMGLVALVTAIILAVWNIVDFKVIEETFALEVAKRVLVSIGVIVLVCGIAYSPVGIYASRKASGLEDKKKK